MTYWVQVSKSFERNIENIDFLVCELFSVKI